MSNVDERAAESDSIKEQQAGSRKHAKMTTLREPNPQPKIEAKILDIHLRWGRFTNF